MAGLLVLWDVDFTLIKAGPACRKLYEIAFADMFGPAEPPAMPPMAGRTDRAIALEMLARAGLPDPLARVAAWQALMAAHAPEVQDLVRTGGRVLPGAAEALAAVSLAAARAADGAAAGGRDGASRRNGPVVQSVLTGNIRELADVKLGALGLSRYLDLEAGAYGSVSEVRADLVAVARGNAAARYQADFAGPATVLVGDTPLDVEAALVTGARAVGVATGAFTPADLAESGAHAVLPDLTDTPAVLSAIAGPGADGLFHDLGNLSGPAAEKLPRS